MKITTILVLLILISCSSDKITQRDSNLINYLKITKNSTWNYEGELLENKKDIEIKIVEKNDAFALDNKGQKYIKDQFGYRNEKYYWIKYPLKNKTTWINKYNSNVEVATIEDINAKFTFGGEEVKNCLKVSYITPINNKKLEKRIIIRVFCPNIWMVSQELYHEDSEGIAQKQLSIKLKSFME